MGKDKKTRQYAVMKKTIKPAVKSGADKERQKKKQAAEALKKGPRFVERAPTALFFHHNEQLGPPYHIIVDTNFINFSIRNKLDMVREMMNCLYAKCIPVMLDSVMAELEKLGPKYRVALRLAKDPRFLRMPGYLEKGHYADDDIVMTVKQHRCFIVATCDKDLRRRLRRIPGVPIMYISSHKYKVERLGETLSAK